MKLTRTCMLMSLFVICLTLPTTAQNWVASTGTKCSDVTVDVKMQYIVVFAIVCMKRIQISSHSGRRTL
jgi:hypothetical protein